MRTPLLLSLFLIGLAAQAAETTAGLQCEYDGSRPKDPYWKMKKENEDKIANGIKSMGISVGHLPRQDMVNGLNTHLAQLCWAKKSLERTAASITAKKNEADSVAAGAQGCDAYNGLNRQLSAFQGANRAYQETLAKALREQRSRYQKFIFADQKALQAHLQNPAVARSFREAWGKQLATEKNFTEADRKQGILSNPLVQIEEEQDLNGSRQEGYDNLSGSIQSIKEKCPSLAEIDPMRASAQKPNEWGAYNSADSSSSDIDTDIETEKQKTPSYDPPPDKNELELIGPVKKEKSGGIGEWAARNKGALLLGAGTAAVVGGALWYKHKQDKKIDETNAWIDDQVRSANTNLTVTSTSTTTNISTGASVDPEATTISATGFPPNAAVNYVIPKITVTVSGPGKDGVQVSIACVGSCSLAGTLTKTTVGGQAEFTDLYFTAPHEAVQLRVTAPNLNSVASPGSFEVVETIRE